MAMYNPYAARNGRAALLNQPSMPGAVPSAPSSAGMPGAAGEVGGLSNSAAGALTTAGAIPSPLSPILLGVGTALKAGGTVVNTISAHADKKRAQAREDEQWELTRRQLLQDMAKKTKADNWQKSFARSLYYTGGK